MRGSLSTWLFPALLAGALCAEESPKGQPTKEQIRQWIARLGSEDFKVRQDATDKLVAAHSVALDAVIETKDGDDPEVSTRAKSIERRIFQQAEDRLRQRGARVKRHPVLPTEFIWEGGEPTEEDLISISCLRFVEQINLNGSTITDEQLEYLRPLVKVTELDLDRTRITGSGIRHFRDVKSLSLRGSAITDEGLEEVGKLTGLTYLNLMETRISDAGMRHLAGLSNLRKVALMHTKISGDGVKHLSPDRLESLNWSGDNVKDDELAALREFKKLESLLVRNSPISGTGLVHLKELPELRLLDMNGCPVTDKAVHHLAEIPSLQYLSLMETKITAPGLAPLAKTPKLRSISFPLPLQIADRDELHRMLNEGRTGPKIKVRDDQ